MADKPVTREEKYLAYLTGDYTGELPKPITRKEKYLYELCLKGMGGEVSPEEIKSAVNEYLEKNPVKPGATTEQAQQIEQNKTDISSLKEDIGELSVEILTSDNLFDGVFDESGFISSQGNVDSNSFKRTSKYYELPDGENRNIWILASKSVSPLSVVLYDTSKNYLGTKIDGQTISGSTKYFRVYVPLDFDGKIYVSTKKYGNPVDYSYKTTRFFKDEKIKESNTYNELKNKFDKIDFVEENTFSIYTTKTFYGFIHNNGSFADRSEYKDYFATDYLFVTKGTSISYKLKHATTLPIIVSYKNIGDNAGVTLVNGSNKYTEGIITIDNDCYVRFVWHNSCTEGYVRFTDIISDNVKHYIKRNVSLNGVPHMNILCFGDSIIGNEGYIADYLAELSGANVINGAIGGTSISVRNGTSDKYRFFDGEKIIKAFVDGDYSEQDLIVGQMSNSVNIRLNTIKSVNKSTLDLIILAYGTNDYTQGKTIEDIENALGNCIDYIQNALPKVKILVLTPTWRIFSLMEHGDNKVYNVSTLKEITLAMEEYCKDRRISVLNSYQNMPLSYSTIPTYMIQNNTDADGQTSVEVPSGSGKRYSGVHFNEFGSMVYAHLINGKINSLY